MTSLPLFADDCAPRPVPDELLLMSWNVNGIRSVYKKGFAEFLRAHAPDVLCLQETRARRDQLADEMCSLLGYTSYFNAAERGGYSGTAIFTNVAHGRVTSAFPEAVLNGEGRLIEMEIGDVTLINGYFPNSQRGEERLRYKMEFYATVLARMEAERKRGRGVVLTGDVNTAHRDIDIVERDRHDTTPGFMPVERAWIDELLALGYKDTLRMFRPEEAGLYTWWYPWPNAQARKLGWRLDYFFVSPELVERVVAAGTHPEVAGSDHIPISLRLTMR